MDKDVMPYLAMKGITKLYSNGFLANDAVDFSVEKDEIHAIIGENGAGKTTLMNILYGLEQLDAGTITLRGSRVDVNSPSDAHRLGIGMVHQHFKLIPDFTVAENIVLGIEPVRAGLFIDRAAEAARIREFVEMHGFSIDPRTPVHQLNVGQMQQVEILKMLYRNAELLILDEPTSVLTEQEIGKFFDTLRSLQMGGKTCIIITHKLQEVLEISNRLTVMRRGAVVAVRRTSDIADRRELARLMIGRDVLYPMERAGETLGDSVLELKDVTLTQRGRGRPLLNKVNLTVRSHEIVGVTGMTGNGLAELEDVVSGLRRITSGQIFHNGQNVTHLGPAELRERGIAYVPADRLHRGSSLQSSVMENMIVANHHRFLRAGFLRKKRILEYADGLMKDYGIDGDPRMAIGTLSGGNIEKAILARELAFTANIVVVSEPTWGLDVAGSQFVYEKLFSIRAAGAGVLLISSALDEIIGIADSIIVMFRGRVVAALANDQNAHDALSPSKRFKEHIGEYMLGLRDDFAPVDPPSKDVHL
jgi:simple sugar transport system ATP-binding protein